MTAPARERAVVFDLGNTLVRWDPRNFYKTLISDPARLDEFLTDVCPMAWHAQHDRGVSMAANMARRAARRPDFAGEVLQWRAGWRAMFDGPIEGSVRLMERLEARNVPLYALTNLPAEVFDWLVEDFPFIARFRDVVVSGVEGVIKPHPRIFEITTQRIGAAPADTVFIDDNADNIAAAQALGFDAVLFEGAEPLEAALRARNLLD
ncbi:MAG: HAD family hydrolase [Maricaulaceae bacterium]